MVTRWSVGNGEAPRGGSQGATPGPDMTSTWGRSLLKTHNCPQTIAEMIKVGKSLKCLWGH